MKRYLTIAEVMLIQKELITEFGGSYGNRDKKSLESAVMRPQSGYYKNIYEEAKLFFMNNLANNTFHFDIIKVWLKEKIKRVAG